MSPTASFMGISLTRSSSFWIFSLLSCRPTTKVRIAPTFKLHVLHVLADIVDGGLELDAGHPHFNQEGVVVMAMRLRSIWSILSRKR